MSGPKAQSPYLKCDKTPGGLRSPSEIPLKYRHIFARYANFNQVQSEVFDEILYSDEPVVVSAPTGSGKTVLFELAIVRLLMKLEELDCPCDFKIIYVAPVKALCMEKFSDWREKFEPIGLECLEATGDSELSDFNRLASAKLIITTPEKWDSLTRKWKELRCVVEAVKLFIIDEVHLVNEDVRGPTLEAIVSRMKTIQCGKQLEAGCVDVGMRFVAASATIPNIEDLAVWLGSAKPACFYRIAESMRPVKLEKHVLGFSSAAQGFRFDMSLSYKLANIIRRYSNDKPTLIFCNSRKAVEMASKVLFGEFSLISLSDSQKLELINISTSIEDTKLKNLVIKGVAYHHAGLSYQDRAVIEDAFRKSLILILVCTNTLAMGVNFPAHLVIIKSTESYAHGTLAEYSESSILQMIGRAGRPQYDLNGVAVIMTQQKNVKKYENLINGSTPVESHLHKHLAEHLNSEIVLQTVTDLEVAMKWIRSTFLYVRAVKCPMNYGFAFGMTREAVEKKLEELCLAQIDALERNELIVKDQTFGLTIASTTFGRLMARYYLSLETMKLFRQLDGNESFLEVFGTIIHSKEFSEFTLRVSDKKLLNTINNKPIRFPIKGKVKSSEQKICCLIQAVLGNIPIQDVAMSQDALRMVRLGERVSKCLSEYVRLSENLLGNKTYKASLNSTLIAKCLKAKLWNDSEFVCKQLKKIGAVYSNLLVNAGKTTFKSILETDPRQLEMILKKSPPFGDEIKEVVSSFPEYNLELKLKSSNFVQVTISQSNTNFIYDGQNSIVIVGDAENCLLFYNNKVDLTIFENGIFEKVVSIKNQNTHFIEAKLIHENLVGLDKDQKIIINVEDDLIESKKPKSKIQSKLQVKRTKKPVAQKAVKASNYENSLFCDDDDYFKDIDAIGALYEPSAPECKETKPIVVQDSPVNCIKRKLEGFTHFEYPKISRTTTNDKVDLKPTTAVYQLPHNSTQSSILETEIPDLELFDDEILDRVMADQFQIEENFINSQISKQIDEVPLDSNEPCVDDELMVSLNLSQPKNLEKNETGKEVIKMLPRFDSLKIELHDNGTSPKYGVFDSYRNTSSFDNEIVAKREIETYIQKNSPINENDGKEISCKIKSQFKTSNCKFESLTKIEPGYTNIIKEVEDFSDTLPETQPWIDEPDKIVNYFFESKMNNSEIPVIFEKEHLDVNEDEPKDFELHQKSFRQKINLKKLSKSKYCDFVASQPIHSTAASSEMDYDFRTSLPIDNKSSKYFRPKVVSPAGVMLKINGKKIGKYEISKEDEELPELNLSPMQEMLKSINKISQIQSSMTKRVNSNFVDNHESSKVGQASSSPRFSREVLSSVLRNQGTYHSNNFVLSRNLKLNPTQIKESQSISQASIKLKEYVNNLENILSELCDNRLSKSHDKNDMTSELNNFEIELCSPAKEARSQFNFLDQSDEDKNFLYSKIQSPNIGANPVINVAEAKKMTLTSQPRFIKEFEVYLPNREKVCPLLNDNISRENRRIDEIFKSVEQEPDKILTPPEKLSRYRLNITRTSKTIPLNRAEYHRNLNKKSGITSTSTTISTTRPIYSNIANNFNKSMLEIPSVSVEKKYLDIGSNKIGVTNNYSPVKSHYNNSPGPSQLPPTPLTIKREFPMIFTPQLNYDSYQLPLDSSPFLDLKAIKKEAFIPDVKLSSGHKSVEVIEEPNKRDKELEFSNIFFANFSENNFLANFKF